MRRELLVALMVALACPAAAQDAAVDPEQAQQTFERGLALYGDGRQTEAAAVWEALLARLGEERGWKILYNLGLAYQAAGEPAAAVDRFERFLRRLAAQPGALPAEIEERREDAATRLQAIKREHGVLVVPAGAAVIVRLDGGAPRLPGFVAYLRPGAHILEALDAHGAVVRSLELQLSGGAMVQLDAQALAPPPPPPPAVTVMSPPLAPPPPVEEPPRFPTGWVIAGAAITAVSFALPIALGVHASNARDEADALGAGHTGYPAALDDFESARTAYQVSYLLPAALAAATATLAIVGAVRVSTHGAAPAIAPRF